jgi:hypothetical protein
MGSLPKPEQGMEVWQFGGEKTRPSDRHVALPIIGLREAFTLISRF